MDNDIDPGYTKACTFRTIQSNEKGFFLELYENVRNSCSEKWLNKVFGNANQDEKLNILFNDPAICDDLLGTLEHVKPVYREKNAKISEQRRLEGERCMEKCDYDKSLILYSQAVMRAPDQGKVLNVDGGLSLSLALWRRADALLKLKRGKEALQDLQFAVKKGLPAKQHPDYYTKLGKSYKLMGDDVRAQLSFDIAKRLLNGNSELIKRLDAEIMSIEPSPIETYSNTIPTVSGGPNTKLTNASINIELKTSTDKGNYIVANERLNAGDILLVEDPIGRYLLPKHFGTHCLHCLTRLVVPIPCPECSGVAFCTVQCMETAVNSYHRYECKFMDLLIGSGMSILCFLALRILTQLGPPDTAIPIVNELIERLCTNSKLRKTDDYLARMVMAAFLMRCLQKSEYFGRRRFESVQPNAIELNVCGILFRLLEVLQFNAHEIFETRSGPNHLFTGSKTNYIGVAVYKTASLFNHDCMPGVSRYFIDSKIVLRTTHPISIGSPVAENYGPIFTKQMKPERQKNLMSRYWFRCECMACKENWPVLDRMDTMRIKLNCPTVGCDHTFNVTRTNCTAKPKCPKCRKNVSFEASIKVLDHCEDLYTQAAKAMENEDAEKAIELFTEGINLFYEIGKPPHKETHIAQESLRACYATKGLFVTN